MPEVELHRREQARLANQVPTDSDIDEETRGEPLGIDDDDEIDAGITQASIPSSSRPELPKY